jgi:hypothetical protein
MQKKLFIDSLKAKYEAEMLNAKAKLNLYLNNSVGIGEHPEVIDEMDKFIDDYAHALDKLNALERLVKELEA